MMPVFTYSSGTLIGHPAVTALFADVPAPTLTGWRDPYSPGVMLDDVCRITHFLADLVDSAFMDAIGLEYSSPATHIGRGTFLGSFFAVMAPAVAPQAPAYEVTDADVRTLLQSAILNGTVPPVTPDACYFVFLPPSVTSVSRHGRSDDARAPVGGYHDVFIMPGGAHVFYAVIPYASISFAVPVSHELAEMVTNPETAGWTTSTTTATAVVLQEIADICSEPAFFHGEWILTPDAAT